MKIWTRVIVLVLLLTGLCACSGAGATPKNYAMYLEPAQLTKEETQLAELLGAGKGSRIYDFQVDDSAKSVQVNTYRLVDGAWTLINGGGGKAFTGQRGRIAIDFDKLGEGMRVAVQHGEETSASSYETDLPKELAGMGYATSVRNETAEIVYEKEIPLVLQVMTSDSSIASYDVEYFYQPERYVELGYEGVFAVTVMFSQQPDSDNFYSLKPVKE